MQVSGKQEIQGSPWDCVRLPEVSTKDSSLILGSLDWALFNVAELGRSLMELQEVFQASFEAFLISFLDLRRSSL